MAGLVLYVGLVFLTVYLVLALLPRGRVAWVGIALVLVISVAGWYAVDSRVPPGEPGSSAMAEYLLAGSAALLAGIVQGIRALLPSMRLLGSYGLLVLSAPFTALFVLVNWHGGPI